VIGLWLALSCTPEPTSPGPPVTEPVDTAPPEDTAEVDPIPTVYEALDGPRLARRASLDLRGVLPDVDELDAVAAGTTTPEELAGTWLEDPLFEERLVHLLAERWHTRVDRFLVTSLEYHQLADDEEAEYAFERAVGEEPLRLIAHLVAEDRSWDEVVTADHTVANGLLAELWPLEHPGGEGWEVATYTDGRPAAGVLATNGLWWRYYTTLSNYNRARVAAITRLLVCEDYAGRLISFTESEGLGEVELEDALRQSPYCMGCHSALDPVAATLFGFWPANEYQTHEIERYHPDRESLGADLLGVEPAWFGDPVAGLNELGAHIAADPRYPSCAVETFAGLMWRRDPVLDDRALLLELEGDFEASGRQIKPLLAGLTATEAYQAGGLSAEATEAELEREATLRLLTPDQLASSVAALTGFTWTWEGFAQLDNDTLGFRVLAGGVDGDSISRAQESPGLTWWLVVQRLAEAAADHAVNHEGPVFDGLSLTEAPSSDDLGRLWWRLMATEASETQLAALAALWDEVAATEGSEAAWSAVLSVLLRDPLFVTS